jgi:uncharacterized membrane protein
VGRVSVSIVIDAAPARVWEVLRDLEGHVTWMEDAAAIRFTSDRRAGLGTTFDCDTRVGPLRLTDRMKVTEWREGRSLGIVHVGAVRGRGRFSLRRARGKRTRVTWTEHLRFPLWLGGWPGSVVGGRVLRRIWLRNLANLKRTVERM